MHPGTQPLGVYLHEGSCATRSAYILEILAHAGVPFTRVDAATLPDALQSLKIIILPHHGVTTPEMGRLYGFVAAGGALIGLGGTSGLTTSSACAHKPALTKRFSRSPSRTIRWCVIFTRRCTFGMPLRHGRRALPCWPISAMSNRSALASV